ncbi:YcnI family protein, partial [Microbacterium aurum]
MAQPATASAHVTAVAADAAPGGYTVVTLRVPTEFETAGTVGLEVSLPGEHPLAVVRNETTPGWDVAVRRTTLPAPIDNGHGNKITEVVSAITFTAQPGTAIAPGEFAEFRLLLGPLPHTGELVLPALQTYSDGTVVSWIERSDDGTEADKPAPVLRLTGDSGGHGHGTDTEAAAAEPERAEADSGGGAVWIAGAALIAALAALALAARPLIASRA